MLRQFRLARNSRRVLINSRKVICLMENEQKEGAALTSTIIMQTPKKDEGVLTVDVSGGYDEIRRKLRWGF